MPRRLRPLTVCVLVVSFGVAPGQSSAQTRDDFGVALQKLAAALAGERGGTRAQIEGALDDLTRTLTLWDARVASLETQLRPRLAQAAAPKDAAQSRLTLGAAYFERGRFTEAAAELSEATHLDPGQQAGWVMLALTLEALDQRTSAREALTAGLAVKQDDAVLAYHLSRLMPPDDRSAALGTTEILVKAAARIRASAVSSRVPFVETPAIDDRASLRYYFLPNGYGTVVAPLLASRQYDAACRSLRELIAHDPLLTDPALVSDTFAAAAVDLEEGRSAAALSRLAAVDTTLQNSSEIHRLRAAALRPSDQAQAIVELETAVTLAPRNERAVTALIKALLDQGQLTKAERVAAQAQTMLRESGEISFLQVQVYSSLGREGDIIGALERGVRAGPLAGLGAMWSALGQFRMPRLEPGADEALVRDVELNPNRLESHMLLGQFRRSQGRIDEAFAEFAAAALIEPASVRPHLDIGLLQLDTGQNAEAITTLQWVVARAPVVPGARYALANALLRVGRAEEAAPELEAFKRLQVTAADVSRRSHLLGALRFQVSVLQQTGGCRQTVDLYQQLTELDPVNATFQLSLADCLIELGQYQRAADALERASSLGAPPSVFRRLADVYLRLGRQHDSDEAARQYKVRQQDAVRVQQPAQ